jgi:hypothetical protein
LCSIRTAQHATRCNTTHMDNPTMAVPRFSETCFNVNVRYLSTGTSNSNQNDFVLPREFSGYYDAQPGSVSVSVIRMNGGAGFGAHGLHNGTSALRGIPRLKGNERVIRDLVASLDIRKRTKKMPEPTNTENRGNQLRWHGGVRLYCRPPSQPNCIIKAASAFLCQAVR